MVRAAEIHGRTLCVQNILCSASAPEDYRGLPGTILAYLMKKKGHRKISIAFDMLAPDGQRQQHLAVVYDEPKWAQAALYDMRSHCAAIYPDSSARPLVATEDRLRTPIFPVYVRYEDELGFTPPRQEALCALASKYGRLNGNTPSRFHGREGACFSAFLNFADYRGALCFLAADAAELLQLDGRALCASAQSNTRWLSEMRERIASRAELAGGFTLAQAMAAAYASPGLVLRDNPRAVLSAWFSDTTADGLFRAPPPPSRLGAGGCWAPPAPQRAEPAPKRPETGLEPDADAPAACVARPQPAGPQKEPRGAGRAPALWELSHEELLLFFRRHELPTAGLELAGLHGGHLRSIIEARGACALDTFLPAPPDGLGFEHRLKYTVVFVGAVLEEFGIALPCIAAAPRSGTPASEGSE